jgi:hypothetical protein
MPETRTQLTRNIVIADCIGAVAAALAAVLVLLALRQTGDFDIPQFLWFVVPPVLAGAVPYVARHPKAAEMDTQGWVGTVLGTVLIGAIFFAIDVVFGSMHGSYKSLLETSLHAGGPFGVVLTVLICPIGTIVCIGGLVRFTLLEKDSNEPEE